MTPQERDLIQSVFDRLARLAGSPKDTEAEAMILALMARTPDAAYQLVQAVVVQEQALAQSDARIADLERQLAAARQQAQQQMAPPPAQGGGLFSGLNPWGRSRVPQSPPPAQPYPPAAPAGWGPQPAAPANPWAAPQAPSAGGSFLRTAAGTAVGVAGGVLLAEGLSNMFGGHAASAAEQAGHAISGGAGAAPIPYDTQVADDGGFDPGFADFGGDGLDNGEF